MSIYDTYTVAFDGGDSSNPIAAGDTITASGGSGNYFGGDSNCKALWDFDSLANVHEDSIGSNDFTNNGVTAVDSITNKAGSAAAILDESVPGYFEILDSALDSGFPLKSGETNRTFSFAYWIKYDNVSVNELVFAKLDSALEKSFRISSYLDGADYRMEVRFSVDGSAVENLQDTLTAIVQDVWYHVAFTYNSSNNAWVMRIYDEQADLAQTSSGTTTGTINIGTDPVTVGRAASAGSFDGTIDELCVFDDVLTPSEIDQIRGGTYAEGAQTGVVLQITYTTDTTGTISYISTSASQFANNNTMNSGGNSITVNGTPASSTLHCALKELSKLRPMKIDGEVKVKRIRQLIPDVFESVGGEYGEDLTDMYDITLRASGDPMDKDGALKTGYVELPFEGKYDRQGDIWFTQDIPLPMNLLGIGVKLSKEYI